jgi:hypothetical protein
MTMAIGNSLQDRFTIQTIVHTVFAQHDLDAVIYPTGNVPAAILTNPDQPSRNDRPSGVWTFVNSRGFPAMTVPAGFTTQVYDRVRDTTQPDSTRITGPVPARLPVGIDFLGLPFGEPMLLRIASAYEARTRHRAPPPGFGPLPEGPSSQLDRSRASLPRPHRRAEEVIVIDDHRDGVVLQIGKITQIIELAPINIRGRTK